MPHSWGRAPAVDPDGARWIADLDGDGNDSDDVTATAQSGVSVRIAGGGTLSAPITDGAEVSVGGLVTLPGSETPVITVQATQGAAGTEITQWHLFIVRDGRLVELKGPGSPPLQNVESTVTGGHDTEQTWMTTDTGAAGEIYTMQYVDQGTRVNDSVYPGSGETAYRVRVWHWVVDGTGVRPELLGESCVVPPYRAMVVCP
jgi:hypothetical protein